MTFASRLKKTRLAKRLGSRELARKAGLGEGHVAMIELRGKTAAPDTALRLAKALDVDAAWLMFGRRRA